MSTNATAPRLLTVKEVAERLRLDRASVYRLVRVEQLSALRLSDHGHFRIHEHDLEQWLDARRTTA